MMKKYRVSICLEEGVVVEVRDERADPGAPRAHLHERTHEAEVLEGHPPSIPTGLSADRVRVGAIASPHERAVILVKNVFFIRINQPIYVLCSKDVPHRIPRKRVDNGASTIGIHLASIMVLFVFWSNDRFQFLW